MITRLRDFFKNLPTLLLAFALAVTVWISAITEADPTEQRVYPRTVTVEVIGQDPGLLLTSPIPETVSVTLSAPRSIWNQILNENIPVRAVVDLSGLGAGTHEQTIQIQVGVRPVEVVRYTPRQLNVELEALATRTVPSELQEEGEPAVGFQIGTPVLEVQSATVSGPLDAVDGVAEVRAILDLTDAKEDIQRQIPLVAVDEDGRVINEVTITPSDVAAVVSVTQRGGYRNVVVKVNVSGGVSAGYRVTNISVFPATVTVFSSDPRLVEQLPGYVDTAAVVLDGARDDLDVSMPLDLPPGVSVVGDPFVEVQVGVAAIEGSITLQRMPVEVIGIAEGLRVDFAPRFVDVILSGPLPVLDQLTAQDVRVVVDVTGDTVGTYQRVPAVELVGEDLQVQSILPASIEITLERIPRSGVQPTATVTQPAGATQGAASPTPNN